MNATLIMSWLTNLMVGSATSGGTHMSIVSAIEERPLARGEATARELLEQADIRVGGSRPWDVQVRDPRVFYRVFAGGDLAIGESYVEGWWECERIDHMLTRIFQTDYKKRYTMWRVASDVVRANVYRFTNYRQTLTNASRNAMHYDIGNDLYERMLDPRMLYTCAYWRDAKTLDEAQEAKIDLICKKLGLKPGMRFLDIGCGWGALCAWAAEKYGVTALGITVSSAQHELAQKKWAHVKGVEYRLQDYRQLESSLDGTFDRVSAQGTIEHLGYKNHRAFLETARRCIKKDGLFLLHTIGNNRSATKIGPFLNEYVFPNAVVPSIGQIGKALEGLFMVEDVENFGPDYDKTCVAWEANLAKAWPELSEKYPNEIFRMMRYYLLMCSAVFRSRRHQLWHFALAPYGSTGRVWNPANRSL